MFRLLFFFYGFRFGLITTLNALVLVIILIGIVFFDRAKLFEKEVFCDFLKKHGQDKKLLFRFYEGFPKNAERVLYLYFIFVAYLAYQSLLLSLGLWPLALVLLIQLFATLFAVLQFKHSSSQEMRPILEEIKRVLAQM